MDYTPRLKRKYRDEILISLSKNYKSIMQVPRLDKICINQGIGKGSSDKKMIESAQQEMTLITGQKAVITKSKKDISNFKLRKGMPVGIMVTLRGNRMYEFSHGIGKALSLTRHSHSFRHETFPGTYRKNYSNVGSSEWNQYSPG